MHTAHNSQFGSRGGLLFLYLLTSIRSGTEPPPQEPETPAASPVISLPEVFRIPAANSSGDCEGRGGSAGRHLALPLQPLGSQPPGALH